MCLYYNIYIVILKKIDYGQCNPNPLSNWNFSVNIPYAIYFRILVEKYIYMYIYICIYIYKYPGQEVFGI